MVMLWRQCGGGNMNIHDVSIGLLSLSGIGFTVGLGAVGLARIARGLAALPVSVGQRIIAKPDVASERSLRKARACEDNILLLIDDRGPLTADEVSAILEAGHQQASARVSELWRRDAMIAPTGEQRPTRLGRQANIMALTDAGRVRVGEIKRARAPAVAA
jgi:hypothetical protein